MQLQLLHLCCVSVSVYNFNPNSPNARVCVSVSVAESVSSPNSPGASHTCELAKCRASDYSRQMPNLNLMSDPIILDAMSFVAKFRRDLSIYLSILWNCGENTPTTYINTWTTSVVKVGFFCQKSLRNSHTYPNPGAFFKICTQPKSRNFHIFLTLQWCNTW